MNRKQKILISIFSIIIVILIVVGITYAYFVTNVKGNPNDTSIIMTSADLKLIYGDGNGIVEASKIEPGDDIKEKTFTVTNTGTTTIDNYGIYLEDVINNFENTNDIVYSLTCSSSKSKSCNGVTNQVFPDYNELLVTNSIDKDEIQTYSLKVKYLDTNSDQSIDMNKTLKAKVQIYNVSDVVNITGNVTNYNLEDYILVGNKSSQINKEGNYKIIGIPTTSTTIYLKDKDSNIKGQKNIDINRVIGVSSISSNTINVNLYGKIVNIDIVKDISDININIKSIDNYNKTINGTLINKIFLNASLNESTNSKLVNTPTIVLGNSSSTEKEFIPTNDNYGVSYYYRGDIVDNFVNYKGMCWRIVRIEGDGSIKVILADKDNTCDSENYSNSNTSSSLIDTGIYGDTLVNNNTNTLYYKLNNWYNQHFSGQENKLKNDTWCLGNLNDKYSTTTYEITNDTNYLYENALKIINKEPSLMCSNISKKYKNYISTITSDELVFSGLSDTLTSTSYILNNATSNNWWTLTSKGALDNITKSFYVSNKLIDSDSVNSENHIRPVITFDARIYASGNGIQTDPYVIE